MTIYDIARKAKVSTATVSRVLNNSDKVKEKTRLRVLEVMEAESFTPNIFARGLGLHTIKMIGLLCTDVSDNFYAQAVSYLERQLDEHGFNSILCCAGKGIKSKKTKINTLLDKHVDAIILVGSAFKERTDNSHLKRASQSIPMVIINGFINIPNIYCVLCDEAAVATSSMLKLIDSGCKNILFLYDNNTYSTSQKKSGYRQALKKRNLPVNNDLLLYVDRDFDSIEAGIRKLADKHIMFDAVLASDDFVAVGAQKSLSVLGITVPIIGFDNSILARSATPSLTSVDNRLEQMCVTAVDILVQVFEGGTPDKKTIFHGELIERETFKTR